MVVECLLCNCPLDTNYEHVFDFENLEQQKYFFEHKMNSNRVTTDMNTKVDGFVEKVNIKFNYANARLYDYIILYEPSTNKPYFFFISEMKQLTKDVTELSLKCDVFQTYQFDFKFHTSFVDRCHVRRWEKFNDNIPTKNNLDEGLEYGATELKEIELVKNMGTNYILATTTPIGKLTEGGGGGGGSGNIEGTCDGVVDNPKLNKQAKYQQDFINAIYPSARYDFSKYNIFASIKLAQAVLESDWGRSKLATQGKNLFGIKADSSWKGEKGQYPTTEYVDGKPVQVMAWFRHYKSWDESVHDHTKFLLDNPRYKEAGVFDAKTNREQAEALRKAGYATDPNYPNLLMEVINGSDLFLYDKKCDITDTSKFYTVNNEGGENWIIPVEGTVTALFPSYPSGNPHTGLDIGCPTGTPVHCSKDGTCIKRAELTTSYGKHLFIQHAENLISIYAHNSELLINEGDKVKAGQVIAKSGATGNVSGPHCHFEIRINNKAINPAPSLRVGDVIKYKE